MMTLKKIRVVFWMMLIGMIAITSCQQVDRKDNQAQDQVPEQDQDQEQDRIETVEPDVVTTVDPNFVYNTNFEGWGTSLAWFAHIIGGWSDPNKEKIADLLFNKEQGLGLNIVRYNIGGGDDPNCEYNNEDNATHLRTGGNLPSYKPLETGSYDWTADANQRWFLQAAKEKAGDAFIAEAFSNSPPYWMTISGCVSGAVRGSDNNLDDYYYDDFADYLTEVVKHFKEEWHISFRTLNPLNEPNTDYWHAGGRQEGAHFDIEKQDLLLNEVNQHLQEKGLYDIQISAPDDTSASKTLYDFYGYGEGTRDLIAQINTHTYYGTEVSYFLELRKVATKYEKRLWMSEVGIGGDVGHAHDAMAPAIDLAKRITEDMMLLKPDAWVYWQVVEDEANMLPQAENSNWGLIHADMAGDSETFYLTKQYYVMEQFTKFIRPGYKIINSGDPSALAAYDEKTKTLILVVNNPMKEEKVYTFDLSNFNNIGNEAQVYQTTSDLSFEPLKNVSIKDQKITVALPSDSVSTYNISAEAISK